MTFCVSNSMLFVREYGRPDQPAPVVIALHGPVASAGEMAPVARHLAPQYRVIEPFRRENFGVNRTPDRHVDDLHEVVLARATDSPPALIGVSDGATLALLYASTHPEWAGPLVLIDLGSVPDLYWNNALPLRLEGFSQQPLIRIRGPVLMIHGRDSTAVGSGIFRRLQRYLPQIEYCELDRCGGQPWNESGAAGEFFSILSGWLREALQPQAL